MTKTQLVAHLAELPAKELIDLQLICSAAFNNPYYRGAMIHKEWGDMVTEAIELKKHQYTDFDEVDSNPIGI